MFTDFNQSLIFLTDYNQETYKLPETIEHWHKSHKDRAALLTKVENKQFTTKIEDYFSTFPSFHSPYGVILVNKNSS